MAWLPFQKVNLTTSNFRFMSGMTVAKQCVGGTKFISLKMLSPVDFDHKNHGNVLQDFEQQRAPAQPAQ